MTEDRLAEAYARIDAANAEDPRSEDVDGRQVPKELLYGQRMTATLSSFRPDAPEAVRLAARAQHIRRWEIPRSDYPEGRKGYLRWRTTLYQRHADLAAEICAAVGYDDDTIASVRALLRKRGLGRDEHVQILEDVICLVFLQHYFAEFARKHDDDKVVSILQKTWAKMSPAAREAALRLDLGPERRLVERALAGTS